MKKLASNKNTLVILLLIVLSLAICLFLFLEYNDTTYAETVSIPVYYRTIINGQYQDMLIDNLSIDYSNSTFSYGSTTENTGISQLLSAYGVTTFSVYSASDELIPTFTYFGQYCSNESKGTPDYIYLFSDYYTISYELDGGINNPKNPVAYTHSNTTIHFLSPTKDGYVFLAWFSDTEFTQSITSFSATQDEDLILYAKWAKIIEIPIIHKYTDGYTISNDIVTTVHYYSNDYFYIFLETFSTIKNEYATSIIQMLNEEAVDLSILTNQGATCTPVGNGNPSSIVIYNQIYTIQYELNDGIFEDSQTNYYYAKDDLYTIKQPIKNGYAFSGWYLDENYETTFSSSDFEARDITLHAKWEEILYIPVYYFNSAIDTENYIFLENLQYYILNNQAYCFGTSDLTSRLGIILKENDSTSVIVKDHSNNDLNCFTYNGMFLVNTSSGIPEKLYIFRHYSVKFYVNGILYYQSNGTNNESIEFPNFIEGFIGKNYDQINLKLFKIGKPYAIYLQKGWSYTDSSDKSWFNESSITLINSSLKFGQLSDYDVNLYAFMTFYKKISGKENPNINYNAVIKDTNGIIYSNYKYSLDDLANEHVTEISSASNTPSWFEKLVKKFKININSPTLDLIRKIVSGDNIEIDELWNNNIAKVILIIFNIICILSCLFILKFIFKTLSTLDKKTKLH